MIIQLHESAPDQLLGMPYGRKEFLDGRVNNGFVDLRETPGRIDEITEVREFPELRQLLLDLVESHFMSWRVDAGMDGDESHKRKGFAHTCYCFLTIISSVKEENCADYYTFLLKRVADTGKFLAVSDRVRILFYVTPTRVKAWEYEGVCLDIWVLGDGHSTIEARKQWARGLKALSTSLLRR